MVDRRGEPRFTVGLDLGGTKCLGLVVDSEGRVDRVRRVPTPRGEEAVLDTLASLAQELAGRGGPGPAGVGIGAAGLVDSAGVLRFAPNLPDVVDLDIRGRLAARLAGTPVQVENDASCAGLAEARIGAARHHRNAILVTLGTGIGGGVVVDGELYRGAHGFAGEIGHMIVDRHGPPCPCGQLGCWERFASGSGLGRLAREAAHAGRAGRMVAAAGGDPDAVRGEHVSRAAAEGDEEALVVMEEFASWVALGLANLANAFDPEIFVLGGGLAEAGGALLDPVRRAFERLFLAAEHRPGVAVVAAELGERAGAIGAALLARPREPV